MYVNVYLISVKWKQVAFQLCQAFLSLNCNQYAHTLFNPYDIHTHAHIIAQDSDLSTLISFVAF